jgi:Fic family protein
VDEGNYTDISDPIWKDEAFPHFFRNINYIAPLEEKLKQSALKLKEINSPDDYQDLFISEVYDNSIIEGIKLSRDTIKKSLIGNIVGAKKSRELSALELLLLSVNHKSDPISNELIKTMHHTLFNEPKAGQYNGDLKIVKETSYGVGQIVDRGLPKELVNHGMDDFVKYYNRLDSATPLFNAVKAHIHFEKIHPFFDGNGRVGRAIMNMRLMHDLGLDIPIAISRAIKNNTDDYYQSFEGKSLDLTERIKTYSIIIQEGIAETIRMASVTQLRNHAYTAGMNERQNKVFERLCFYELEDGFKGKFTNETYQKMANMSDQNKTAARDLKDLVNKEILQMLGTRGGTHYTLNLTSNTSN